MPDYGNLCGGASRSGQRIVNSVVALQKDFVLFSFDISQASAKGATFEEIAKRTGTELRNVEFDLPPPLISRFFVNSRGSTTFHDFGPALRVGIRPDAIQRVHF